MPYSLLLDPVSGKAAAYTNIHQLITELASNDLIDFALANHSNRQPFDARLQSANPHWRPLPPWATPEVQARMEVIWIRRPVGDDPDEAWRAIPER